MAIKLDKRFSFLNSFQIYIRFLKSKKFKKLKRTKKPDLFKSNIYNRILRHDH